VVPAGAPRWSETVSGQGVHGEVVVESLKLTGSGVVAVLTMTYGWVMACGTMQVGPGSLNRSLASRRPSVDDRCEMLKLYPPVFLMPANAAMTMSLEKSTSGMGGAGETAAICCIHSDLKAAASRITSKRGDSMAL
jgi:hypothetical protein